jgi:hypothetical protein
VSYDFSLLSFLTDRYPNRSDHDYSQKRRLIQFNRHQNQNEIEVSFSPLAHGFPIPDNIIVVSCIYFESSNKCYITSVDLLYLLEALMDQTFSVEEKNRIRRNLEKWKPLTVSKNSAETGGFFRLIMDFGNPKPRNIEKDIKCFVWDNLSVALSQIVGKYVSDFDTMTAGRDSDTILHGSLQLMKELFILTLIEGQVFLKMQTLSFFPLLLSSKNLWTLVV